MSKHDPLDVRLGKILDILDVPPRGVRDIEKRVLWLAIEYKNTMKVLEGHRARIVDILNERLRAAEEGEPAAESSDS